MNSILMFNVVILLFVGIYMFDESHSYKQYIGGFIVFLAIILLAFDRNFEKAGTHTETQNIEYLYSLLIAFGA